MRMRNPAVLRRTAMVLLVLVIVATLLVTSGDSRLSQVHAQGTLGSPLAGLTAGQINAFNIGLMQFSVEWDPVKGLGPDYTNQNCALCHQFATGYTNSVPGGTSPVSSPMRTTFFGKLNGDGSFNPLTSEGGFVLQPLTSAIFIKGCPLRGEVLPSDATLTSQRLPPDLFGFGLIDSIPDVTITQFATNKGMGIQGTTNVVTDWNGKSKVGRFGTKAQFGSLLQAVGMAFLHDIGVTNPVDLNEDCPNAAPGTPSCPTNIVPMICIRDKEANDPNGKETLQIFDYLVYLAPNSPTSINSNGQALFTSVGCALCHNPQYTTKANVQVPINFTGGVGPVVASLSKQPVSLYSDLLIHHLGPGLADCMQFGQASGDQWRTTPLWGVATRPLYLHDGRAADLMTAIEDHFSTAGSGACGNIYPDSEANQVITNFNALSPSDQADLISFVNSL